MAETALVSQPVDSGTSSSIDIEYTQQQNAAMHRKIEQLEAELAEANSAKLQQDAWLAKAAGVCELAAFGDLEARLINIDVDESSDLGKILHSINALLDYTDAFVREAKAVLAYAAEEKFYRKVVLRGMNGTFRHASELINAASNEMYMKAQRIGEGVQQRLDMADSFETTIKNITDSVANTANGLQDASTNLSQTAGHTSGQCDAAMELATQSVENVRHVAEATDQLQNALSEIDNEVLRSSDTAHRAVTEVKQATQVMKELDESSENIDRIVETIAGITKQTELLSLNAAIEAAHAGSAGSGFAVVATEVRKLAEQTREATNQVKMDIGRVQLSTKHAVGSINQFGETVGELSQSSESIAGLVTQQLEATASIHANLQEVTSRSETVNATIRQASTEATETATETSQLLDSANELSGQSAILATEVERVLCELRADS